MNTTRIHLNQFYNLKNDPILEITTIKTWDDDSYREKKTIIIVPGGAYNMNSLREGDPIALPFLLNDYVTCKLTYSTKDHYSTVKYPIPHLELCAAMDYINNNYKEYQIDINKITMIGCSAGGHLVASYCYLYDELGKLLNILDTKHLKPKAIVLSYPVITLLNNTHQDTKNNITEGSIELINKLSIQNHIDNDYPPTFIWSTETDDCVPIINTKLMNEALNKANVNHETIIFQHGHHGLSIDTELVNDKKDCFDDVQTWVKSSINFLDKILEK